MKLINFFALFIGTGAVLFAMGYGVVKWSRMCIKQEGEYAKYYGELLAKIDDESPTQWVVNKPNYNMLMSQFKKLGNMKWKDRKKTQNLFFDFMVRFESEANKSVNE